MAIISWGAVGIVLVPNLVSTRSDARAVVGAEIVDFDPGYDDLGRFSVIANEPVDADW